MLPQVNGSHIHNTQLQDVYTYLTNSSYYSWTQAKTIYGKSLHGTWMQKKVVNTHNFTATLNFTEAYNAFVQSATVKLALQSKSTALCEYHLARL